jgi:hypothetical protein
MFPLRLAQGCGTLYCSEECRELSWRTSHRLLCVGTISDAEAATHPLVQYKLLVSHPDMFNLAAQCMAQLACAYQNNGGCLQV